MKFSALLAFVLISYAGASQAQSTLVGKYTGNRSGEARPVGMEIEIKSAENGTIQGAITLHQRRCGGTFPVEGTYSDSKLELQAAGGGRTGDCGERKLELAANGRKLSGRMLGETGVWRDVEVSR